MGSGLGFGFFGVLGIYRRIGRLRDVKFIARFFLYIFFLVCFMGEVFDLVRYSGSDT